MKTKLLLSILLIISIGSFSQTFEKITVGSYVTDTSNCVDAAWGDYDKDGDMDLFVATQFASGANLQSKDLLFQNNCNGELTKVQSIPGELTEAGEWSNNAVWVDYDNDDDLDLYVSTGPTDNLLYQNQGEGTFVKITGVNVTDFSEAGDASGIAWSDYDNDGYLDLFITDPVWDGNKLFHNNGDGSFTKITDGDIVNTLTRFSGCAWSDYDNDGDADLFVTTKWITPQENYVNYFYENNGDGTFTRILDNGISNDPRMTWWKLGVNYSCYWIDYNNDRHMDLYITSVYGADYLYKNNGDKTFTSITNQPIVTTGSLSNGGSAWGDYDNDGDLDVAVSTFGQNLFFVNDGAGSFTQNTQEIISNDVSVESYGMAWADYDNDGDLDLYIPNAFGAPNNFFYVNVYQNNGVTNNWFKFSCKGVQSNTQAVGAKVYVKANINGSDVWQMREISAGSSLWGGGNSGVSGFVCHYGLGDASIIDTLKIVWPTSGITQIFTDVDPNQHLVLEEGNNDLVIVQSCYADLPVRNPGYVEGKMYYDVDDNCVFDAGTDEPIANKIVQLNDGPYFVYTDDNGDYQFRVAEGDYDINLAQTTDNTWELQTCAENNDYSVQVTTGNSEGGYELPLAVIGNIGLCDVSLEIHPIGSTVGPCDSLTLSSPCPTHYYDYVFTIENTGTNGIDAGSKLLIQLDPNMVYDDVTLLCSYSTISNVTFLQISSTDIEFTINDDIPINGDVIITVDVFTNTLPFPATNPYITTATYSIGTSPNLIDNGDFELGYDFSFGSDYLFAGCLWGEFAVITDLPSFCAGLQPNHLAVDNTSGTGNFFYGIEPGFGFSQVAWRKNVSVNTNSSYTFNAFVKNVSSDIFDPDPITFEVWINGALESTFGPIFYSSSSSAWTPISCPWFSGGATSANIEIICTTGSAAFGIDDISFTNACEGGSIVDQLEEYDACSCDPNDLTVYPKGCGEDGNISKYEELKYRIRFQNKGAGPAHNIVIKDVIDEDFDLTSLKVIASSHEITHIEIMPGRVLLISFENIELPAEMHDVQGSNGYVIFKVMPKENLADGTQITNNAGIYFDNNDVVITNATLNTLWENPKPVISFAKERDCQNTMLYNFTYTGEDNENFTYSWYFGQDAVPQYSTDKNPIDITYITGGDKIVSLTVDNNECSSQIIQRLIVEDETAISCGNNKVLICKTTPNGKSHTICVNINSLPAHLANGACLGTCPENNTKSMQFDGDDNDIESSILSEYNIYPNPTSGNATISFTSVLSEIVNISVYNSLGEKVADIFNKPVLEGETIEYNYDFSGLTKGVYTIVLQSNSKKEVKQFVITK